MKSKKILLVFVSLIFFSAMLLTFTVDAGFAVTLEKDVPKIEVTPVPTNVTFDIYDSATATTPVASQTFSPGEWAADYGFNNIITTAKSIVRFRVNFTNTGTLTKDMELWVEIKLDGTVKGTRELVKSATHALFSEEARNADKLGAIDAAAVLNAVCANAAITGASLPPEIQCKKIVFASSANYTAADLFLLAGADYLCQALADAAGLPGTYKAWLSDDFVSARDRLTHNSGPYVRVDGLQVAASWADLLDSELDNPISLDENGGPRGSALVWTGTDPNGVSTVSHNCSDWMEDTGNPATYGGAGWVNARWTQFPDYLSCYGPAAIYCFQQ